MRIITNTFALVLLVFTFNLNAARIEVVTMPYIGATPSVHHSREVHATVFDLEVPTRTYTVGKGGDDDIKIPEGEDVSALISGLKIGSGQAWTFRNIGKRSVSVFTGTKLVKMLDQNESVVMKRGDLYKVGASTYVRLK